jgi:hypothetical protein
LPLSLQINLLQISSSEVLPGTVQSFCQLRGVIRCAGKQDEEAVM